MSQKVLTPFDMSGNEIQNVLFQVLASDPGSPVEGQFWYNSTSKTLKFYNGSVTIVLGRLDQLNQPTADISLNSHKLTSVTDPTSAQDAATKGYVDTLIAAQVAGLSIKDAVRAATTANGTLATAYENGDAIDGITLATGDRILLKNQTTASENGIYIVNASGAPTRATDFDGEGDIRGALIPVEEGTVNADSLWMSTANSPITVGSSSLTFLKLFPFSSGTFTKVSQAIGDGSATSIDVTHNIGVRDVQAQVYRNSSPYDVVLCDIEQKDANTTTFKFTTAPSSNQFKAVIVG